MEHPHYKIPIKTFTRVLVDGLLGRSRSFKADAVGCVEALQPPLQIIDGNNIPGSRPCVLTVNHYSRPGFRAEWLALAISAVVPVEVHWIMTGELTFPGKWYKFIGRPLSRFILKRAARIYGFTNMPPMPPRPQDMEERAQAMRVVLEYVRCADRPIIGLAPEGGDQPGGQLSSPPSGFGRFALLLASFGMQFLPVGAYEAEGKFWLRFGGIYELKTPGASSKSDRNDQAAIIIMNKIAALLPGHLIAGPFTPSLHP